MTLIALSVTFIWGRAHYHYLCASPELRAA
jgi:hypothetical protein